MVRGFLTEAELISIKSLLNLLGVVSSVLVTVSIIGNLYRN